jgi:hypothetical protein
LLSLFVQTYVYVYVDTVHEARELNTGSFVHPPYGVPEPVNMTVLDELFESNFRRQREQALQSVIADSLRRLRQGLASSEPTERSDVQTRSSNDPGEGDVRSTQRRRFGSRVATRSQGVQTSNVVPLMSVRCQRPQRGLLGPVPGSLAWAHHYCRELLRQSNRR